MKTALKGYLVAPIICPCSGVTVTTGVDPAFLIVQNKKSSGAEKYTGVKNPKVLPANLLAKIWRRNASTTISAQGYLFAGMMDQGLLVNNTVTPSSAAYDFGDDSGSFESQYLWSIWNDEDPGSGLFVETWLTHAGFGTAVVDATKAAGCSKGCTDYALKTLSGSVIGGSFSCEPNEFDPVTWQEEFLCQGWNESVGNQQYLMDAITGTWSIKANKSIRPAATLLPAEAALLKNLTDGNALEELQLLKACGQKIDKSWNLLAVEPNFASKWF